MNIPIRSQSGKTIGMYIEVMVSSTSSIENGKERCKILGIVIEADAPTILGVYDKDKIDHIMYLISEYVDKLMIRLPGVTMFRMPD